MIKDLLTINIDKKKTKTEKKIEKKEKGIIKDLLIVNSILFISFNLYQILFTDLIVGKIIVLNLGIGIIFLLLSMQFHSSYSDNLKDKYRKKIEEEKEELKKEIIYINIKSLKKIFPFIKKEEDFYKLKKAYKESKNYFYRKDIDPKMISDKDFVKIMTKEYTNIENYIKENIR